MTTEDEYSKLLKRATEGLKKESDKGEADRFLMPVFQSFIEGKTTLISNFTDVARKLGRELSHLVKFFAIEVGAQGEIDGHRLRLNTAKNPAFLNQKLEAYVKEFVICKECGKPDTEIRMIDDVPWIKCGACSAKYTIREI